MKGQGGTGTEKHINTPMEGPAGQKEATVEESESRIRNQTLKEMIRTYCGRFRSAVWFRADTAGENCGGRLLTAADLLLCFFSILLGGALALIGSKLTNHSILTEK